MIALKFSLYEYKANNDESASSYHFHASENSQNVIWFSPEDEGVKVGNVGAGSAQYVMGEVHSFTSVQAIRFEVTKATTPTHQSDGEQLLATKEFTWPAKDAVLRLDQVTFPANAIAYRHTHAGAGFRYLTTGGLEIDTGAHQQMMQAGDQWFEEQFSPVKATAMDGCVSQFIRAMVVPIEFRGKPTINILDPDDAGKPSLQTNHRFIDQVIGF